MWGSPLKPKKEVKVLSSSPPTIAKEKMIEKFKPIKMTMTKSEAKKILDYKKDLAVQQILWVQNWLETLIRERSLPPQLSGSDGYSQLLLFLNPLDALSVLKQIREDFGKMIPLEEKEVDDYSFLSSLELGAYHEHLPPPHRTSHNNQIPNDDL
jgi:hypothetical protein